MTGVNTLGNKKSGCIELFCAKTLANIYEAGQDYDAVYDAMESQYLAWRKERRNGWERVLVVIERMLTVETRATADFAQDAFG